MINWVPNMKSIDQCKSTKVNIPCTLLKTYHLSGKESVRLYFFNDIGL